MSERTCVICGINIDGAHTRATVCSNDCRGERHRQQGRRYYYANREKILKKQRETRVKGTAALAILKDLGIEL